MGYQEVWVDDPNVDDVLGEYTDADWLDFVEFWREPILKALGGAPDPADWLNDPIKRLEVIAWLRANGYTVEPVS
jgi:hypothetical protein